MPNEMTVNATDAQEIAQNSAEAKSDRGRKFAWLTVQNIVIVVSLLVGAGIGYQKLIAKQDASDTRATTDEFRIAAGEARTDGLQRQLVSQSEKIDVTHDMVKDMQADLKVLLDRVPKPK